MNRFFKNKLILLILSLCLFITVMPLSSIEALPITQIKVTSWQWIDANHDLIRVDNHWELVIADASKEKPLTIEELKSLLPSSILAQIMSDDEEVSTTTENSIQEDVESQNSIADDSDTEDQENAESQKNIDEQNEDLEVLDVQEIVEDQKSKESENLEVLDAQEIVEDQKLKESETVLKEQKIESKELYID